MRVLVVKSVACDNCEDEIVMLVSNDPIMVRGPFRLVGAGRYPSGNPYCKYGKVCEDFTGKDKLSLSITVAENISGSLCDWSMDYED
jgi:hypothetical protein